jgi:hypothetical protein
VNPDEYFIPIFDTLRNQAKNKKIMEMKQEISLFTHEPRGKHV